MIEVDVAPTPNDLRPLRSGWGALHWVSQLPLLAGFGGFILFGLTSLGRDGDTYAMATFLFFLIGTFLAWWGSYKLAVLVMGLETRRSPSGSQRWRWRLTEDEIAFDSSLQRNTTDWRAIKTVIEEADRFLFLVTPGNNPVLPKRNLSPDQVEALRALIQRVEASGRLGVGVD